MQESLYLGFDPLVAQSVVDFFNQSKLVTYRKGEIICRSDTSNDTVYCTKSGCVLVYTLTPEGHRDIHTFTRPKTVFPMKNLFTPEAANYFLPSRTRFFEAMTDLTVWQMPGAAFGELVLASPDMKNALLQQVCLNHRIDTTRIEMMQLRNIGIRVSCFLLVLGLLIGDQDGKQVHISSPVSHQLIADSLSIARETASRELSKLRKQGLIEYADNKMVLTDVARLKNIIENY